MLGDLVRPGQPQCRRIPSFANVTMPDQRTQLQVLFFFAKRGGGNEFAKSSRFSQENDSVGLHLLA